MDVQKYIKRLKFARADMSRATGPFETYDEAINFLNQREFFFGDPFVVKYKDRDDNGEVKLLLAIGKAENPTVEAGTTEVTGATGPEAYELFDMNGIKDELEKLWEALNEEISARTEADIVLQENIDAEASARTAADEHLQEQIDEIKDALDAINELIEEISGTTENLKEIVGEGWTDSPDNVTITDRIKRDEQLAGIYWGHKDGEPYDGHLPKTTLPYASGESVADMIKTISDTLDGVLFEDNNVTKAIKFEYNPDRNILYYTAGTETGEIKLSQASVVNNAYYDADTEELVIIFNKGEGEEQEVRIDVKHLIEEWDVQDTNTVRLHKERVTGGNPDILTADVKVASSHPDNILETTPDGLKVSNAGIVEINNKIGSGFTGGDSITEVVGNIISALRLDPQDAHFIEGSFTGEHTQGLSNYLDAINALDNAMTTEKAEIEESISETNAAVAGVKETADKATSDLTNIKDVLSLADDGHFVEGSFTGEHTQGLSNYCEAINALDGAISDVEDSVDALDNKIDTTKEELNQKIDDTKDELDGKIDTLSAGLDATNDALANEVAARKAVRLVKVTDGLAPDVREAYTLENEDGETSEIIKIYKDSVIYKIYFGHVDDQITSPTDPTVIPGTGETAICFIYFNANGEYALSTTPFEATDELWEAVDELRETMDESEKVTAIALNRLAEAVVKKIQDVVNEEGSALSLVKEMGDEGFVIKGDVKINPDSHNMIEKGADGSLFVDDHDVVAANEKADALGEAVNDLTERVETAEGNIHDLQTGLTKTNDIIGPGFKTTSITDVLGTGWTGDSSVRHAINHLQSNVTLVSAVTEALKGTDNSFQLVYDPDRQEIILKWEVDGVEKTSRVDASDFVKDSFLDGVQVVNREGVKYLEFKFKTYDGEPVPIYVPLTDLAVIYKDGDGIDREALEEDQIITVKLDEVAHKNWLAKSANGLRVTGVTEAIDEAIENLHIEDYVRKDEVEDHLDSASTLPVQNKIITAIIKRIDSEIEEIGENYLNDVVMTGDGNVITAVTKSGNEIIGHLGNVSGAEGKLDKSVFNDYTAATHNSFFSESICATTYNNLPTATTSQYGVVILDDHLDSASTNPVENKVLYDVISELSGSDSFDSVVYNETANTLTFKRINGGTQSVTLKDGMVDDFMVSGGNLVLTFNEDAGKEDIAIPLSAISSNDSFNGVTYDVTANTLTFERTSGESQSIVLKDGMVDDFLVSGTNLVLSFNEDADKEDIAIPLSEIFDPTVLDGYVEKSVFSAYTADTKTILDGKSDTGHTHTVDDIEGLEELFNNITAETIVVSAMTADTIVVSSITANTISATEYENLPTATTTQYGVVIVDDHLDTASTNPVENRVITQVILEDELVAAAAFNDLKTKKADRTEIPTSLTEFDEYLDLALKTDLEGYLPLSGGTMTGDISGETGVAIYMPGGFFQQSDERLKIFLGDIDNALAQVKEIPTKYFYWKEMCDGPRQIGTSAQRVKEVVPEVVSGDDVLSVDYSKLSIVALAAIKELAAKVEDLQKQIDELKK